MANEPSPAQSDLDALMSEDPLNLSDQDIDRISKVDKSYAEMLIRKAIPNGECLDCHRSAIKGYPKISAGEYAHRFVYETLVGPIGDLWVLHKCDNTRCINPKHLFLGTHQDNTDDMMSKGRLGNVGGAKSRAFTELDRLEFIRLNLAGISQREIARRYNTTQTTIWDYINGKHLEKCNG